MKEVPIIWIRVYPEWDDESGYFCLQLEVKLIYKARREYNNSA